jgi:hypothetical protein
MGDYGLFPHTGVRLFKMKGIIYLCGVLIGARRLANDQTVFIFEDEYIFGHLV